MKENTDEKSLLKVNENSIFYKIKQFFKNLFHKNEPAVNDIPAEANIVIKPDEDKKNTFMEEIKKIEDEETLLLKLQKKYRSGEIKEEDLTSEQVNSLCKLYDKQIANLRKSNEIRKQKLLEYRRRLQTDN
ncbi:MAG: hypothetical protein IKE01_04165 [Clostridia bacterium]|nr:hypothetical protein [Clostridia bacterium]